MIDFICLKYSDLYQERDKAVTDNNFAFLAICLLTFTIVEEEWTYHYEFLNVIFFCKLFNAFNF